MTKNISPLVSVIITTKNEEKNINNCLMSIVNQTYKNKEIIVVDNNSLDKTKDIAKRFSKLVFNKGPERSAQRNFGAKKAKGNYLLFLDADMILTKDVIKKCVEKLNKSTNVSALVIPEKSFGEGFWAQCKALERSFYLKVDWIEAARFYKKTLFKNLGGYSEEQTGTEDFDLPQRLKNIHGPQIISRVSAYILHNEGRLSLFNTMKKKYYYSKTLQNYKESEVNKTLFIKQSSILQRYWLFFKQPKKLLKNPAVSIGMLTMKTLEFVAGGLGYLSNK